ncbi:MAG: TonB-dependent receptor [Pseudomonadota bacterium]|nr:TonB-dependent receptor [Pseudomonadota bacterium]
MSAHAQVTPKAAAAEDTSLQEVVVTGSRIARPEFDNLEPTTTVDSKAFDQRGYLDVGQALSELPAFGVAPSSAANTQSGFGVAQSFVDLYGLGSQRTLTLVNGRRFVSESSATLNNSNANTANGGNGTQVDLNVIPTKLIDHVEVVSVGGAPIYGADAIAGVVNIILKKDYQGLDVDAQVGASGQGDAWNYRTRVLGGQNLFDGKANITAVAEFTKTDGLVGTSRPVYSSDLGFLAPVNHPPKGTCCTSVLTPANSVPAVSFGGVPLVDDAFFSPPIFGVPNSAIGITNGTQVQAFGPGGTLVPYNVGTPTGNPIFNSGGDGERLSQVSNLLSPTERVNIDTLMHYQLNDRINFFGEGYFSESHATNLISQPAYNTGLFGTAGTPNGNFVVSVNNPFLSPGDRTAIQTALNNYAASLPFGAPLYGGVKVGPGQPVAYPAWNTSQFYISRASTDLESGRATDTQIVTRGVVGANGDFSLGDRNFNWEVSTSYGAADNTQVTPSYVFQNLANALNATKNAAGQIVCAGTPVNGPTTTVSSTCAPLNIFGSGSPSIASLQYITHLATVDSFNTQRDTNAFIGGDIMKVPAGEWKFSSGFENRREAASFNPDNFYTQGLGQATITPVAGSYITNEAYFETLLPIFSPAQDIPGLHRLEVEGAARRVNNSIAGNATTYTYAVRWSPVEDVGFRANKTKSIRAPSITELFLPSASVFSFANDPCDKNYVDQGPVPATRAKNCAAAIAAYDPKAFQSTVVNATALGTTSGNTGLQSEVAFSKTFGVVLRPRFVPKLNISVDYIDIALKSAIQSLSLVDNLDACYDSANYPNNPSCNAFTRNAAGQITNFHSGYVNAGLLEFTGIQAALDYTFELPWALGSMQTSAHYLDTQRLKSQIASAAPNDISGQLGYSKSKATIDLLYANRGFSWDWEGIFIGSANFNNQNTPTSLDVLGVGAWWLINSTIGMKFTPAFQVRLIVDNVFNKQPPFPAIAGTGGNFANATSVYFSGILGRSLQLSADYKFF